MNRPSIPPSPQSRIIRKPLLNITAYCNNSMEAFPTPNNAAKPSVPRSESTTNIRQRNSSGQSSKLQDLRKRKSSLNSHHNSVNENHDSQNVDPNYKIIKPHSKVCNNHKTRLASHELVENPGKYCCLECALLLGRQNIKICKVKSVQLVTKQKNFYPPSIPCKTSLTQTCLKRQSELNKYLQKSKQLTKNIKQHEQFLTKRINQINIQYSQRIKQQKRFMQEQIEKIQKIYQSHIHALEERKIAKISELSQQQSKVENYLQAIKNTQIDIQMTAMEQIKKKLSDFQFQAVIDQYWKIVRSAQKYVDEEFYAGDVREVSEFCIQKQLVNSNMENTCQAYSGQKQRKSKSHTSGQNFTFSKKQYLQTPQINKTLKGIKFAKSIGQSERNSSLRSSIVDSKFVFQ